MVKAEGQRGDWVLGGGQLAPPHRSGVNVSSLIWPPEKASAEQKVSAPTWVLCQQAGHTGFVLECICVIIMLLSTKYSGFNELLDMKVFEIPGQYT